MAKKKAKKMQEPSKRDFIRQYPNKKQSNLASTFDTRLSCAKEKRI
jgi:hypothetical protein